MKKLIPIFAIAALLIGFFALGFDKIVTFENIKASLDNIISYKSENPIVFTLAFLIIYIASAALSLPIVVPLSLIAGAVFGLVEGVILVSFGSSIGASLAFLISRFIFRDTIEARFGDRLKPINDGIEKDGAFYLFSLRLIPIFPFYIINLLMGLTKIRLWTFYWVSQIGMLIGTVVYVNAGTQIATLNSPSGILSPALIASLALLGILPWLAKMIVEKIKSARIYKGFIKPKTFDRDIIIIGAGAAGLVSAYIGAAVRAKITIIEANKMGGDCLNYGCVPSKALIKSAKIANSVQISEKYGINSDIKSIDFRAIMARIKDVIKQIEPHDSIERYTQLGAEVIEGYARIIDPWRIEIVLNNGTKQLLTCRNIIIATGAKPIIPKIDGIDAVNPLTSDTLWEEFSKRDKIPQKIVILGAGPIGCELSQAFARLGARVSLIEMAENILTSEDNDVSDLVKLSLEKSGIEVYTSTKAIRIETNGKEKSIIVQSQSGENKIQFDEIICAIGRAGRIEGYGLEDLGIEAGKSIATNEFLQTKYPNIYAAGDVAGPIQLTHVAAHQAWYASVNALFGNLKKFKVDYKIIPRAIFIDPEVARVGINEKEAIAQKIAFETTYYGIDDLDRAIADGANIGFVKILTPPKKDKILGVSIVGEQAGELIQEYVLAMKWGLGLNKILGTIHSYPTMSEANKYAAGAWKRKNVSEWQLTLLEKFHAFQRGKK